MPARQPCLSSPGGPLAYGEREKGGGAGKETYGSAIVGSGVRAAVGLLVGGDLGGGGVLLGVRVLPLAGGKGGGEAGEEEDGGERELHVGIGWFKESGSPGR